MTKLYLYTEYREICLPVYIIFYIIITTKKDDRDNTVNDIRADEHNTIFYAYISL